jgi:P4 family phage/plasmid primase-like protien
MTNNQIVPDLQEIAKILDKDYALSIFRELTQSEPRNKKAIRLFDDSTTTSEVFYEKTRQGGCMVYDHKNRISHFPVNSYAKICKLSWRNAVIALGKEHGLIQYTYEQQKYVTPPKPKVVITEKEQKQGVCIMQNLQTTMLTGVYLDFWAKLGVTYSLLDSCNVRALQSYELLNTETKESRLMPINNVAYTYEVAKGVSKIYQPYSQKYKWSWYADKYTQKPSEIVYCLNIIPKNEPNILPKRCNAILIVEGLKDALVINANFNELGIFAIGLDSASSIISQETLTTLQGITPNIWLCLDNDKTGIEQNELKSKQNKLPICWYPENIQHKDIAVFYEKEGKEKLSLWLKSVVIESVATENVATIESVATENVATIESVATENVATIESVATENVATIESVATIKSSVYIQDSEVIDYAYQLQQGIADLIARLYKDVFLFDCTFQKWLYYDNGVWLTDNSKLFENTVFPKVRQILASVSFNNKEHSKIFDAQIKDINLAKGQNAIVKLAQNKLATIRENFDVSPYLLCLENGVFNFENMRLEAHSPDKLLATKTSINLNNSAKCDKWQVFLAQTFGGDCDVIEFIQKIFGLCLTGETIDKAFFLFGDGANGKSVLVETLRYILGSYYKKVDNQAFSETNIETKRKICGLEGKRAVVCGEIKENSKLDESAIKDFTGGEVVTARYLFVEDYSFMPQGKIILYGNHKPIIRGTDNGIWRRFICIPFENTIPENQQNKQLAKDLQSEKEGILLWAIKGYRAYKKEGLKIPTTIKDFTNNYRQEQNVILNYFSECMQEKRGEKILLKEVLKWLQIWCKDTHTNCNITSVKLLRKELERNNFICKEGAGNKLYLHNFEYSNMKDDTIDFNEKFNENEQKTA